MFKVTDVFVIGGGPAGLAAAIAARMRGLRVMVADGAHPPIDKACGEGVMPDGLTALRELGVPLEAEDSFALRGIRFISGGLAASAHFPNASFGRGVRRTVLHEALAQRAADLGVDVLWGTSVMGISKHDVHLATSQVKAQWIIGADGANSRVRRWANLEHFRTKARRYAFRRHYDLAPWTDRVEVYWGKHCEIYVTPVSRDRTGVALISQDAKLRLDTALPQFPELQARLFKAAAISPEKGAMTANLRLRRVSRENIALVGDASGMVDAITGEGLCLSFRQALALADCLEAGTLEGYARAHRRLALRPQLMSRILLLLDGRPGLQRRTLLAFRKRPYIFQRLLELHVGELSPLHLTADGLRLGWELLMA